MSTIEATAVSIASVRLLSLGPAQQSASPLERGDRVDVEHSEAVPLADARAQQAHAAGHVIDLLQLDLLSAQRYAQLRDRCEARHAVLSESGIERGRAGSVHTRYG